MLVIFQCCSTTTTTKGKHTDSGKKTEPQQQQLSGSHIYWQSTPGMHSLPDTELPADCSHNQAAGTQPEYFACERRATEPGPVNEQVRWRRRRATAAEARAQRASALAASAAASAAARITTQHGRPGLGQSRASADRRLAKSTRKVALLAAKEHNVIRVSSDNLEHGR